MKRDALTWLSVTTVLAVFAVIIALVDGDVDLWGRMAFARDAAQAGAVLTTEDPYSYTSPGVPWFDHEWGFNWLAWGAYRLADWPGLRILRVFLFTLAAVLVGVALLRQARRDGAAALPTLMTTALMTLWALGAYRGFYGPRAQSVGYVFFAWLVLCLREAGTRGPRWLVVGVLPLFLWVNVHAGFVAGLGIAGVWGAFELVRAIRQRKTADVRTLLGAGALAALALMATPLGFAMTAFAFRAALISRPFIPEWAPLLPDSRHFWEAVALVLLTVVKVRLERPRRWAELGLIGIVAGVSFQHGRHLPFLATIIAIFCGPAIVTWAQRSPAAAGSRQLLRATGFAILSVCCVGALLALTDAVRRPEPREPLFPFRAVNHLKARHAGEGGIVEFNWSMYALFQAPELKLAFDGRYTDVYPFEIYKQYFQWHLGLDGGNTLLDDPRTRFVLVAKGSERDDRMRALPDWAPTYADEVAVTYARSDGR